MEKYSQIIDQFFTDNGLTVDDFFTIGIWMNQNEITAQGWKNPRARKNLTDIGGEFLTYGKGATAHETCIIKYLSFTFRFTFCLTEV